MQVQVTTERNLGYQDTMGALRKFSELDEHWQSDMAVVVVLSHGDDGLIFSSDGRKVSHEGMLRYDLKLFYREQYNYFDFSCALWCCVIVIADSSIMTAAPR